jgi:hypothetical protein
MGARLGKPQKRRPQPKRTVIIDLGNSSDEELFDIGVQNLAPQGHDVTDPVGKRNGTVSQKIHREIEQPTRRPSYTAKSIAYDVLRCYDWSLGQVGARVALRDKPLGIRPGRRIT